ncbi:ABC transporter ATP-binding protein [Reinekea sp. G2M2-21]|uniref:ABC transporter ATP-binding protein n=1 Tax=Reinekea sp. G2M2-21 TaxID=2788942 RepID=UPI0018AACAEE
MSNHSGKYLLSKMWSGYIKNHIGKLIVAICFMLLESGSIFVLVKQLQPMVDKIFVQADPTAVLPVTLAFLGVFLVKGFGSFAHRSLTVKAGMSIVGELQQDLTNHLLRLDIAFFNRHAPGELIERVRGDTQALQSFASGTLLTFGRDTATLVAMIIAAMQEDIAWTLIIFVGLPVLLLPMAWLQKAIRRLTRRARESSASLSTRLDEIFHGIKAIKLNNLLTHEEDRFKQDVGAFVKNNLKSEYGRAAMPSIIDIVAGLGFVAVIFYGGQEILAGEKTAGSFITFFFAIALVLDPLRRLTNVTSGLQMALANLERIFFVFDQQPTERPNSVRKLANPNGDIRFEQVNFSYGNNVVLNNLSFVAPGGKTTAFVGPSGAGKSTLFNVLTQLELQSSGDIFIGDDNLADIDLLDLRQDVAVVSQESALFDESIRDNIWLGDLTADEAKIDSVADTALVSQFAKDLPDGLDSLAGPRGTNLSGGQRQRVIIARALLRNAPILLLDEATSALDNNTEQKIQALLDAFTKDKTTLVIAHRLTTVMNADVIHVMKNGAIVESGTHNELLALNGHYAELHTTLER